MQALSISQKTTIKTQDEREREREQGRDKKMGKSAKNDLVRNKERSLVDFFLCSVVFLSARLPPLANPHLGRELLRQRKTNKSNSIGVSYVV